MADAAANAPQPVNRPAVTLCVILAVIMQPLDRSCLDPNAEEPRSPGSDRFTT
jgi:hypothetical protein